MEVNAELRRLIACNAYAAYLNTLVGNPAPRIAEEGERTRAPQPGDVVLETSTIWRWHDDPGPALGVLLRDVREPIYSREEFDAMHAEGDYWDNPDEDYEILPTEQIFYVRPLDGSVEEFRWHNATFIRVHSEMPHVV